MATVILAVPLRAVLAEEAVFAHTLAGLQTLTITAAITLAFLPTAVFAMILASARAFAGLTITGTVTTALVRANDLTTVETSSARETVTNTILALPLSVATINTELSGSLCASAFSFLGQGNIACLATPSRQTQALLRAGVAQTVTVAVLRAALDRAVHSRPSTITSAHALVTRTVLTALVQANRFRAVLSAKSCTALATSSDTIPISGTRVRACGAGIGFHSAGFTEFDQSGVDGGVHHSE